MSGYFKTPNAFLSDDGKLLIGYTIFNKKYQYYSGYKEHVGAVFITLGYIPQFELSLRITRRFNAGRSDHTVDRMFSGKLLIFEERGYIPAFSVGLQNPYSTLESANHFNSTYFVISKSVQFSSVFSGSFTIGRGFDWIKSADHEFIGFFGGAEIIINPLNWMSASFIIENTALRSNAAVKILLFNHFAILAGFEGMDALSLGSAIIVQL